MKFQIRSSVCNKLQQRIREEINEPRLEFPQHSLLLTDTCVHANIRYVAASRICVFYVHIILLLIVRSG
jgi:hypothetical protein